MSVQLLHKRNSVQGAVPSLSSLELGELAINTIDGKLFIKTSDGIDENIVEFRSGTSPISVSELNAANQIVSGTTIGQVTNLAFDQESGFDVTDLGNGTVKIGMNSTFKFWEVDGQDTLIANGLDHIEIAAGNGIKLTTDVDNFPYQKLTISTPPKTVQLYQDGFLEATTGTVRWYAPGDITVNRVATRIGTTSNVNVQTTIKKSGSTAETVILAAGTSKQTKDTSFTMNTDDYLTIDLVLSGNSTGSGMSVEIFYIYN
jgi:hypothetical protein